MLFRPTDEQSKDSPVRKTYRRGQPKWKAKTQIKAAVDAKRKSETHTQVRVAGPRWCCGIEWDGLCYCEGI